MAKKSEIMSPFCWTPLKYILTIMVWIVRKDSILLVVKIRQLCFKFVLLKHSAYKNLVYQEHTFSDYDLRWCPKSSEI